MSPDVVVVGAGGCGPVVARELAGRGVRVLVLEAGPWLDPDRDLSLLEDDSNGLFQGSLRWGPGDRSRPPWRRVREGAGLILQVAGVGGTTLHYNAISPRAFVPNVDKRWPLSYTDLVPHYERVEEFLPVAQVRDLAEKDALFAEGCEAIGLPRNDSRDVAAPSWKPCYNAILPIAEMSAAADPRTIRYPETDGCTMCGHCLQGCPHPVGAPLERKAKRATNVSYVPAALATGRCEIVPNAFATSVLWEALPGDGRPARVRGVRWRDTATGQEHEVESPVVVMACGSIESPRLWLSSRLPNTHDAVGRRLTMHLQDFVTGFFDREVHPNVGQVTMARADFPGYGTFWAQGYGPQAFAAVVAGTGGATWDDPTGDEPWDLAGRGWGRAAVRRLREYHRTLTLCISTNDEAHPDNRVSLATDWDPDEHGPIPRVVYEPTPASQERQDWLARKGAEVLRAAGAREVHRTGIRPVFMSHLMGTMRMGRDPAASVVDEHGEAHEVAGMFVADTSVLPGVGGANPTLTAQALATRTADRIADRHLN
ncbi:MAG: GMC family oxidoreductase [Actinobacteria bacterium]|nr:GMC family oxidoreductase [Actinomycetota bacterium]